MNRPGRWFVTLIRDRTRRPALALAGFSEDNTTGVTDITLGPLGLLGRYLGKDVPFPSSGTADRPGTLPGQTGYRVGSVTYCRPDGVVHRTSPFSSCSTCQRGSCFTR